MSSPAQSMKAAEAILLIGPTGSGKTPLGSYIEEQGISDRRCHHFDFGNELRTIAGLNQPPHAFSLREHRFIRDLLAKGLLLENEHFPIAEKILLNFLKSCGYQEPDLLILNGLPRHAGQARDMARLVNVTHLLVLACTAGSVCERIEKNSGGDRTLRTDDSEEMIRKKLDIYQGRTAPLIRYYADHGSTLVTVTVDATSTPQTITAAFASHLMFRT